MDGQDVVIVGAGGHALVAIEVLRAGGREISGCVSSDGAARADVARLGVRMLGSDDELLGQLDTHAMDVFVAIGDNRARRDATTRLVAAGAHVVSAVSPASIVSPTATVAEGALIMPGAVVNALAQIDAGVIVNTAATIDHECRVGAFAHIAPGVALAGNVTVGVGTLVGIGAAVAPGCRIGSWTVVGAGATVVADVGDDVVVVGTPARAGARR